MLLSTKRPWDDSSVCVHGGALFEGPLLKVSDSTALAYRSGKLRRTLPNV